MAEFDPTTGYVSPASQRAAAVNYQGVVRAAGVRYFEGVNQAFVAGGDSEGAQLRVCEGCPAVRYCGAVAAAIIERYPNRTIPKRDRPILQEYGVQVSDGGFS